MGLLAVLAGYVGVSGGVVDVKPNPLPFPPLAVFRFEVPDPTRGRLGTGLFPSLRCASSVGA